MSLKLKQPMNSDKWHYAAMTGEVGVQHQDGTWDTQTDHLSLLQQFLKLRENGTIEYQSTVRYGHPFFHGHSGVVSVYEYVK